MIRKKSFDLAMEYFDTNLWEEISDCDMFAVRLPEDRIGYCIVMGMMGNHISLAMYIGEEGLSSLYKMLEYDEEHPQGPDDMFCLRAENALQCQLTTPNEMTPEEFKEAYRYAKTLGIEEEISFPWPILSSWKERRTPYPVNRQQEDDLVLGLKAGIYLFENLETIMPERRDTIPWGETIPLLTKEGRKWTVSTIKVPSFRDISFLIPELPDSSLLDFIRRKPVRENAEDLLSLRVLDIFITDELSKEDPAPYYPLILARSSQEYFTQPVISHGVYQEHYNNMLEDLAEQYADAEFKPEFITVDSRHAFYFMKAFCEAVGITLQIAYPLEEMEDLFDNMYDDMFNPVSMYQQFEEYAEKHPEARKQLDKLLKDNNKGELDAEELYDLFSRVMDDSSKE